MTDFQSGLRMIQTDSRGEKIGK